MMLRRLALALLFVAAPGFASAQLATIAPTAPAATSNNQIATTAYVQSVLLGGLPLASGKVFIGSAGNVATAQTVSGDCTLSSGGALTCTKINGLVPAFGQVRLAKSGSNIVLSPKNGNLLTINGVAYPVPSAGVSLAPTGLTASTLYYVYAYMNAGTMTLEASATGHSTSTTAGNEGVEIKTSDDTRALVGMVRPIAGPAFADTIAQRFVRSWFNRNAIRTGATFTANRTFTGAFAEINTEIRNAALLWANETWSVGFVGAARYQTGSYFATAIAFDGTLVSSSVSAVAGNAYIPVSLCFSMDGLSEGYHYATMLGGSDGTSDVAVTSLSNPTLTGNIK